MTRFHASRAFVWVAAVLATTAVLAALAVLAAAALPALAHDQNPTGDIRKFIVFGDNVDKQTETVLEMWHGGDSVTLEGPITISVYTWREDGPGSATNTYKLGTGEDKTFALEQYTESHPGDWNTRITLVSVDFPVDKELLELLFGVNSQAIDKYIRGAADSDSFMSAIDASKSARAAFAELIKDAVTAGNAATVTDATTAYGFVAKLGALEDAEGEPLFPSLASEGMQAVIAKMAVGAVKGEGSLTALKNLVTILIGLDMAKHTATMPS